MSFTKQTPVEAAKEAMTRDGYEQGEITGRQDILEDGMPDETASWLISANARYRDGEWYDVEVHVKRNVGGIFGDVTRQVRKIS